MTDHPADRNNPRRINGVVPPAFIPDLCDPPMEKQAGHRPLPLRLPINQQRPAPKPPRKPKNDK